MYQGRKKGGVATKTRPKSYAKHMLGLHKNIWERIKVEEYLERERGKLKGQSLGVPSSVFRMEKRKNIRLTVREHEAMTKDSR